MPLLTMNPRGTCTVCGCRLRGFRIGTYRINKTSLRSDRGGISWVECPECGPTHSRKHPTGVLLAADTWVLEPDSQAIVNAYHARKGWTTTTEGA